MSRWSHAFALGSVARASRSRPATAAAVAVLLASGLQVATAPQRADARPTPEAAAQCPDQRPDAVSAAVTARLCDKKVEISGELSETTRMWAFPDGSRQAEIAAGPVRYRDGATWVDVDLTMVERPDGTVGPAAHPRGLTVSGGGDAGSSLVTLGRGRDSISFGWSASALPAPVLSGATATYSEVLPGVDVVIEATRQGYRHLVVVNPRHDAATAQLPAEASGPARLLEGKGVQVTGGLVEADGFGYGVFALD